MLKQRMRGIRGILEAKCAVKQLTKRKTNSLDHAK
jgi:hypothetical protein